MKHILLFKIKEVCYQSYFYFADSLGSALEELGFRVSYYDSSIDPLEDIDKLCGKSFSALIDFNSMLPKLRLDSGEYLLDCIDAPFFNIILDHPLYHHDMLKQTLRNFHVLSLDLNHIKYMKKYYPHLKSVSFFPMTGSSAKPAVSFEQRDIPLLFTGSCTPSVQILDVIQNLPDFLKTDTQNMLSLLLEDNTLTMEDAATAYFNGRFDDAPELFPLQVQSLFLADTYQRALRREELLSTLVAHNIPLTICGANWNLSQMNGTNLTFLPAIPFEQTFSLMNRAKIVLNLLPEFKNGVHDRIYSGMLNGAVSMTDSNPLLEQDFQNETNILFYKIEDASMTTQGTSLESLLSSPDTLASIASAGQKKAQKNHTWKQRAVLFSTLLQDVDISP